MNDLKVIFNIEPEELGATREGIRELVQKNIDKIIHLQENEEFMLLGDFAVNGYKNNGRILIQAIIPIGNIF